MVSDPVIQIAYRLLQLPHGFRAEGAELKRQAHDLAAFIEHLDLCTSCWMVYSNGATRSCEGGVCLFAEAE